MYFLDALKLLLRRWYVVAIGMAVVGGLCVMTVKTVPTQYQASGQLILLLPPTATGVETPSNPYLNLQPGLTTTAALITGTVMSKDSQRDLKERGFTSAYAVGLVPDNGPLLMVSASDTDPAEAVATRDEVMRLLERDIAAIQKQAEVPARQLISLKRSSVGANAEVLPGSKLRALVAVFALGVIITLALAFLVDRIIGGRQRRRGSPVAPAPTERTPVVATLVRRPAREGVRARKVSGGDPG